MSIIYGSVHSLVRTRIESLFSGSDSVVDNTEIAIAILDLIGDADEITHEVFEYSGTIDLDAESIITFPECSLLSAAISGAQSIDCSLRIVFNNAPLTVENFEVELASADIWFSINDLTFTLSAGTALLSAINRSGENIRFSTTASLSVGYVNGAFQVSAGTISAAQNASLPNTLVCSAVNLPHIHLLNELISVQANEFTITLTGPNAGISVDECTLQFLDGPSFLPDIILTNCSITAQGFSGSGTFTVAQPLELNCHDVRFSISTVAITLLHNTITAFSTDAQIKLPGFPDYSNDTSSLPDAVDIDSYIPITISENNGIFIIRLKESVEPQLMLGWFVLSLHTDFQLALNKDGVVWEQSTIAGAIGIAGSANSIGVTLAKGEGQYLLTMEGSEAVTLDFSLFSFIIQQVTVSYTPSGTIGVASDSQLALHFPTMPRDIPVTISELGGHYFVSLSEEISLTFDLFSLTVSKLSLPLSIPLKISDLEIEATLQYNGTPLPVTVSIEDDSLIVTLIQDSTVTNGTLDVTLKRGTTLVFNDSGLDWDAMDVEATVLLPYLDIALTLDKEGDQTTYSATFDPPFIKQFGGELGVAVELSSVSVSTVDGDFDWDSLSIVGKISPPNMDDFFDLESFTRDAKEWLGIAESSDSKPETTLRDIVRVKIISMGMDLGSDSIDTLFSITGTVEILIEQESDSNPLFAFTIDGSDGSISTVAPIPFTIGTVTGEITTLSLPFIDWVPQPAALTFDGSMVVYGVGTPEAITLSLSYADALFTGTLAGNRTISIDSIADIELSSVSVSKSPAGWGFDIDVTVEPMLSKPSLGDVLPKSLSLEGLSFGFGSGKGSGGPGFDFGFNLNDLKIDFGSGSLFSLSDSDSGSFNLPDIGDFSLGNVKLTKEIITPDDMRGILLKALIDQAQLTVGPVSFTAEDFGVQVYLGAPEAIPGNPLTQFELLDQSIAFDTAGPQAITLEVNCSPIEARGRLEYNSILDTYVGTLRVGAANAEGSFTFAITETGYQLDLTSATGIDIDLAIGRVSLNSLSLVLDQNGIPTADTTADIVMTPSWFPSGKSLSLGVVQESGVQYVTLRSPVSFEIGGFDVTITRFKIPFGEEWSASDIDIAITLGYGGNANLPVSIEYINQSIVITLLQDLAVDKFGIQVTLGSGTTLIFNDSGLDWNKMEIQATVVLPVLGLELQLDQSAGVSVYSVTCSPAHAVSFCGCEATLRSASIALVNGEFDWGSLAIDGDIVPPQMGDLLPDLDPGFSFEPFTHNGIKWIGIEGSDGNPLPLFDINSVVKVTIERMGIYLGASSPEESFFIEGNVEILLNTDGSDNPSFDFELQGSDGTISIDHDITLTIAGMHCTITELSLPIVNFVPQPLDLTIVGSVLIAGEAGTVSAVVGSLNYAAGDFTVTLEGNRSFTLDDIATFTVQKLEVSRTDGDWDLDLDASVDSHISIPTIGNLIPDGLSIEGFSFGSGSSSGSSSSFSFGDLGVSFPSLPEFKLSEGGSFNLSLPAVSADMGNLILTKEDIDPDDIKGVLLKAIIDWATLTIGPVTCRVENFGLQMYGGAPDKNPLQDSALTTFDLLDNDISIDTCGPTALQLDIACSLFEATARVELGSDAQNYSGEITIEGVSVGCSFTIHDAGGYTLALDINSGIAVNLGIGEATIYGLTLVLDASGIPTTGTTADIALRPTWMPIDTDIRIRTEQRNGETFLCLEGGDLSFTIGDDFSCKLTHFEIPFGTTFSLDGLDMGLEVSYKGTELFFDAVYEKNALRLTLLQALALERFGALITLDAGTTLVLNGSGLDWDAMDISASIVLPYFGLEMTLEKDAENDTMTATLICESPVHKYIGGFMFEFRSLSITIENDTIDWSRLVIDGSITPPNSLTSFSLQSFVHDATNWLGITSDNGGMQYTINNLIRIDIERIGIDLSAESPLDSFFFTGTVTLLIDSASDNYPVFDLAIAQSSGFIGLNAESKRDFTILDMACEINALQIPFSDWTPQFDQMTFGASVTVDIDALSVVGALEYTQGAMSVSVDTEPAITFSLGAYIVGVSHVGLAVVGTDWIGSLSMEVLKKDGVALEFLDKYAPKRITIEGLEFGSSFDIDHFDISWTTPEEEAASSGDKLVNTTYLEIDRVTPHTRSVPEGDAEAMELYVEVHEAIVKVDPVQLTFVETGPKVCYGDHELLENPSFNDLYSCTIAGKDFALDFSLPTQVSLEVSCAPFEFKGTLNLTDVAQKIYTGSILFGTEASTFDIDFIFQVLENGYYIDLSSNSGAIEFDIGVGTASINSLQLTLNADGFPTGCTGEFGFKPAWAKIDDPKIPLKVIERSGQNFIVLDHPTGITLFQGDSFSLDITDFEVPFGGSWTEAPFTLGGKLRNGSDIYDAIIVYENGTLSVGIRDDISVSISELTIEIGATSLFVFSNRSFDWDASHILGSVTIPYLECTATINKLENSLAVATIQGDVSRTVAGCTFNLTSLSLAFTDTAIDWNSLSVTGSVHLPLMAENETFGIDTRLEDGVRWITLSSDQGALKCNLLGIAEVTIYTLQINLQATSISDAFKVTGAIQLLPEQENIPLIEFDIEGNEGTALLAESLNFDIFGMDCTISQFECHFDRFTPTIRLLEGSIAIVDDTTIALSYDNGMLTARYDAANPLIIDLDVIIVEIDAVEVLRSSIGDWSVELDATIKTNIPIPGLEDFVPREIELAEMVFGTDFSIETITIHWDSEFIKLGNDAPQIQSINFQKKIGPVGYIERVDVEREPLDNGGKKGLKIAVTFIGARFDFGPVEAYVDGFGIETYIGQPGSYDTDDTIADVTLAGNNVGLGIIRPKGLGVSFDTGSVSGAGYLFMDEENDKYYGGLSLNLFDTIDVRAVGIFEKVNGEHSFLVVICSQFPGGVPLGLNFYLKGVGGLVGYNRTMDVEKVRGALRTGAIDNIAFPDLEDGNMVAVLSDLQRFFPAKSDQFVVGPMARIIWNNPAVLTIDAGILVEFPNPIRIAIMGILKTAIPNKERPLLKLNAAFLGVIDFDKGMLSFDASIYDSKLLTFGLFGDLCLRLSWGQQKSFVISAGGFHPSYTPPSYLAIPEMRRMTIVFHEKNPRVILESYFAVTSNTVQVGARASLTYKKSGAKVSGHLGFNTLFQFDPFAFIADFSCGVSVKVWGCSLCDVSLYGELSGPTPWKVYGKVRVSLGWFGSVTAKVSVEWGDKSKEPMKEVALEPLFRDELERISNWEITEGRDDDVTFVDFGEDSVLYLAPNGDVTFNQTVLPLKKTIERFGTAKPNDINKVTIKGVEIGDEDATIKALKSEFPTTFFKDLSGKDGMKDKLSASDFEKFESGLTAEGHWEGEFDGKAENVPLSFEIIDYDPPETSSGDSGIVRRVRLADKKVHSPYEVSRLVEGAAIARTQRSFEHKLFKKSDFYTDPPREDYAVAFSSDLQLTSFTGLTRDAALEKIIEIEMQEPQLAGELIAVPHR
ncbi:MAG: hypothetical protein OCD01_05160 [Fibrobacterales bacterium]